MNLRTLAAAFSLLNGGWILLAGLDWNQVFGIGRPLLGAVGQPSVSSENAILILIGAVLIADSFVCFLGWTQALYVSAAISLLGVLALAAGGVQTGSLFFAASALAGLLTIVVDILAARKRTFVPEADHPLNLPVFG